MTKKNTLILSGFGLNCEKETLHCCQQSGAQQVDIEHWSRLLNNEIQLQNYHFIIFIGGFLDGDDLGSGRVAANRFRFHDGEITLQAQIIEFIQQGKLVLGICNGFQFMVKLGILPGLEHALEEPQVTLTTNTGGRFEDRWVKLIKEPQNKAVFLKGIQELYLPVRHGEGRLVSKDPGLLLDLKNKGLTALYYADDKDQATESYPHNPNGSPFGIAALSNPQGNVLGLMPHPEAFHHYTNHPHWTRLHTTTEEGQGLPLFKNAYQYLKENF